MKKLLIIGSVIFAVVMVAIFPLSNNGEEAAEAYSEVYRFHIRANSNDAKDQYIKYAVKDKIVELISPLLSNIFSSAEASAFLNNSKNVIESYANVILGKYGVDYSAHVDVGKFYFDEKEIDGVTFGAGYYDSMVVSLGCGLGNNWWGLVYPELSFVPINNGSSGSDNIIYRSKLVEIFESL